MADKAELAAEVIGVSIANKTTTAGAVAGVVGWLSQINWIGLSGVLIALGGLAVNFYFQWKRNTREERESIAREAREQAESAARVASIYAEMKREVE